MEKNKNLKYIIILLIIIILLLVGFIIFCAVEFLDERAEIRRLYNNGNTVNVTNNDVSSNEKYISREEALKVALTDIGVNQEDVYDIDIELDYKYSKTVFEVNFNYGKYEYEYYINAEDGTIVKSFKEIDL